eukprot:TRINITY_DN13696_c0_g1_i1.p1 TRINITY_DN13696_c0_g1~~TRINITY_DN13696_c0_g1_i1.p1  ORF type:complete len:777 (+),score=310.47 TRINITY_DN13696_c0_g1_i1:56-2386(+)
MKRAASGSGAPAARNPYVDKAHFRSLVSGDAVLRDAGGNVVFVFVKAAVPEAVRRLATPTLALASKPATNRATIAGGKPPMSGIAGYFDYAGVPSEHKCRKTTFTRSNAAAWPSVFPLVEYVSEAYRAAAPRLWAAQDRAIPDAVRIRGSVFSTLTINTDFRTARHTDSGDFDHGLACLTVLCGDYSGLHVGFPDFETAVDMRPGDLLLFNSHHQHCNTEPEQAEWSRLSCVLYYRYRLGEAECMREYARRRALLDAASAAAAPAVRPTVNLHNTNVPARAAPCDCTPVELLAAAAELLPPRAAAVAAALRRQPELAPELLQPPPLFSMAPRPRADYAAAVEKEQPARTGFRTGQKPQARVGDAADRTRWDDAASLRLLVGDAVVGEWEAAKERWLAEVLRAHSRRPGPIVWPNTGAIRDTFNELCGVTQTIGAACTGVDDMADASDASRMRWWEDFAVHMCRECVRSGAGSALTMAKLNTKIRDFQFGGTRYFEELPEERRAELMLKRRRVERRRDMRGGVRVKAAEGGADAAADAFDYQTEDCAVDYAGLQIPPAPAAFAGLAARLAAGRTDEQPCPPLRFASVPAPRPARRPPRPPPPASPSPEHTRVLNAATRQYPRRPAGRTAGAGAEAEVVVCETLVGAGAVDAVLVHAEAAALWGAARLEAELAAAARALREGGALFAGCFTSEPADSARLKPAAAAACAAAVKAAADHVASHYGAGELLLMPPAGLASAAAAAGLRPCGVHSVRHSALNEFVLVAVKEGAAPPPLPGC